MKWPFFFSSVRLVCRRGCPESWWTDSPSLLISQSYITPEVCLNWLQGLKDAAASVYCSPFSSGVRHPGSFFFFFSLLCFLHEWSVEVNHESLLNRRGNWNYEVWLARGSRLRLKCVSLCRGRKTVKQRLKKKKKGECIFAHCRIRAEPDCLLCSTHRSSRSSDIKRSVLSFSVGVKAL